MIDKINLQTKVGSRLGLKFNKVEQEFLDMSEACKTWEDVVECATAIYEWSKENETRTEDDEMLVPQMFDLDEEGTEEGDEEESEMEEMEKTLKNLLEMVTIQTKRMQKRIHFPS